MSIDPEIWSKLHGASTHFPLAMAMGAALFDGLGTAWPGPSVLKERMRAAGYCAIVLGALGVFPAVLSGLVLTKGEVMGHDALLFHHLFVWPACAGIVGLGVWRVKVDEKFSTRGFAWYLATLVIVAGLMAGAGYWGGEMILQS